MRDSGNWPSPRMGRPLWTRRPCWRHRPGSSMSKWAGTDSSGWRRRPQSIVSSPDRRLSREVRWSLLVMRQHYSRYPRSGNPVCDSLRTSG